MFDVVESLLPGLRAAQSRLEAAQDALARSSVNPGGRSADAAMAQTARAAIFNEALLGAVHSRFAEIKSVTRS